jgi:hypothetical protein
MPLSDDAWSALARGLRRAAARAAPGWTDANAHDPGVTVLELLAFALDELSYRSDRLNADARAIARSVAARAGALAGRDDASDAAATARSDGALVRPRFFAGQLLTADDLAAEQDYQRDRIDRRNRVLHGAGVVEGLEVSVDDDGDGGPHVAVAPGLAFDRVGREIFVGCGQRVALRGIGTTRLVCIAYREHAARLTPAVALPTGADAADGDAAVQANRIVESFEISLGATAADDAIAIARVRRLRGRWQLDRRFRVVGVGRQRAMTSASAAR